MNSESPVVAASPRIRWTVAQAQRRKRNWIIGAAIIALLILWLAITAPLSKSLQPVAAPSLTLLSAEGELIARRGAIVGEPTDVGKLPPHVWQAFLAIEDRRFYTHLGVDPIGLTRALVNNISAGGVREGGSTITQQLAKLAFLDSGRTLGRKLQEMPIAIWMEIWLSKDEILNRYLSSVYFGNNVYGLSAAARHYFNVAPEQLSIPEAAMLAGLVKAPSRLNPHADLQAARDRAQIVINSMVDGGVLEQASADSLRPATPAGGRDDAPPTGTYFADWVFPEARERTKDVRGPQDVETTLEAPLQRLASQTMAGARLRGAQMALIAMRPDGRVVAMVGGRSYSESRYNRVTQALRQPGSTFKLFVYLAALRDGMTPDTLIEDAPITVNGWSPQNSDDKYRGRITLREAFAVSSNVAAVRLAEKVGRGKVISAARDLGISSELKPHPSTALGTSGVTLLELTAAYAAVAAGSYPVPAHGLPQPKKGWFERWTSGPQQLDDEVRRDLLDLLRSAVEKGTGKRARLSQTAFGKTGTTQDNRDALFIGFSHGLITGVWIGNDDNSPLQRGSSGGTAAASIWRQFMREAIARGLAGEVNRASRTERRRSIVPMIAPQAAEFDHGDRSREMWRDNARRNEDAWERREERAERREEEREERAERAEEREDRYEDREDEDDD